jgi:D-alanyl-D-alanine dipeptidase
MILRYEVWIVFVFLSGLIACKNSSTDNASETRKVTKPEMKKKANRETKKTESTKEYDYNSNEWDEISYADDSIVIDLRYAQTNNFVKKKMYKCARCFLRPYVADKLNSVNSELLKKGYKLKVFDCYRPKPVQEELWEIMPDEDYVAAPWKGSMHNRGIAVDLTIVDINNKELDMGTPFDFFGEQAHFTFKDLPEQVLENRNLLKTSMEKHGFQSIRTEWWHYSVPSRMNSISDWQWHCY